jgi:XRE family transcriptional regulator, regulator of sulfur utilization
MDTTAQELHLAIGSRVQELRRASGDLSQEKLASRAGVHRTFIGKVERGETATTIDSIAAICAALGISLSEFFLPFDRPPTIRGPRRRR